MISLHDGFAGIANWAGFLPGGDRVGLDFHPYLCFGTQITTPMSSNVNQPCTTWAASMNDSMTAFGLTSAGEFSNAINDCGTFLNGVGLGARYDGSYTSGGPWPVVGSCQSWVEYQSWSQDLKTSILQFALASMDALQVSKRTGKEKYININTPCRIGSFGRGKLEIRQPAASLNPLPGRINLACRMGGCRRTLVRQLAPVERRIHGSPHWHPHKLVAPVLARSRFQFLLNTRGLPFPLATLALLQPFHDTHRLVPSQHSPTQPSPLRVVRLTWAMGGKIPRTLLRWQFRFLPALTLAHGAGQLRFPRFAVLRLLANAKQSLM